MFVGFSTTDERGALRDVHNIQDRIRTECTACTAWIIRASKRFPRIYPFLVVQAIMQRLFRMPCTMFHAATLELCTLNGTPRPGRIKADEHCRDGPSKRAMTMCAGMSMFELCGFGIRIWRYDSTLGVFSQELLGKSCLEWIPNLMEFITGQAVCQRLLAPRD